jgi:hypothetical protein
MERAHRHVWEQCFGPIPAGVCVCHRCDNRLCVNPSHLFLGTRADNNRDMQTKGRQVIPHPRGENNGYARLTVAAVKEIRRRYRPGDSKDGGCALAREFGVSQGCIWLAMAGRNWGWVT